MVAKMVKKSALEKIKDAVKKEVEAEVTEKYAVELKTRYRELESAKKVLRNCELNIEALEIRIQDELG